MLREIRHAAGNLEGDKIHFPFDAVRTPPHRRRRRRYLAQLVSGLLTGGVRSGALSVPMKYLLSIIRGHDFI